MTYVFEEKLKKNILWLPSHIWSYVPEPGSNVIKKNLLCAIFGDCLYSGNKPLLILILKIKMYSRNRPDHVTMQ